MAGMMLSLASLMASTKFCATSASLKITITVTWPSSSVLTSMVKQLSQPAAPLMVSKTSSSVMSFFPNTISTVFDGTSLTLLLLEEEIEEDDEGDEEEEIDEEEEEIEASEKDELEELEEEEEDEEEIEDELEEEEEDETGRSLGGSVKLP